MLLYNNISKQKKNVTHRNGDLSENWELPVSLKNNSYGVKCSREKSESQVT